MDHSQPARPTLAVVVPAYNEAAVLAQFHARLAAVFDALDAEGSVLYVDDGSRDATWQVICNLAERDPRVAALRLARNFGKEAALTAGLDQIDADLALVIDADLQDPPELIPEMVALWRGGASSPTSWANSSTTPATRAPSVPTSTRG